MHQEQQPAQLLEAGFPFQFSLTTWPVSCPQGRDVNYSYDWFAFGDWRSRSLHVNVHTEIHLLVSNVPQCFHFGFLVAEAI